MHRLPPNRRLGLLLCLGLLSGLLAPVMTWRDPATVLANPASEFCADPEEAALVGLVNAYRAEQGKGALVFDLRLGASADHHSLSMADNNYFSHDLPPEGIDWFQNIRNHGYNGSFVGENIAAGNATAAAVLTQWKNSPPHNANMLDAGYGAVGIGRAYRAGSRYGWYWTANFGNAATGATAPLCAAAAATPTATPIPSTASPTPVPPTGAATGTPVPSTVTPTKTVVPPTATPTKTAVPPMATSTNTPILPTTATSIVAPATSTSVPYTATYAPSITVTTIPTAAPTDTTVPVPTDTPTPLPTITFPGQTPSISLSKEKSKFNGVIDATLGGFGPGAAVTLLWPDGTVLATAVADGAGNAFASFRTPLVAFGTYRVEARDATGKTASESIGVIPRIMLNEETGPVNTRLRVYFYGFAPGEQVEVRWYAAGESAFAVVKTVAIAPNGRGSSLISIPARTGPGDRKVMGRVIGIARSASTTFRVTTAIGGADVAEPIAVESPTAAVTPSPTIAPTAAATAADPITAPVVTTMLVPTPEPTLNATATPQVIATPAPAPLEEPTPVPTSEPTATAPATAESTVEPAPEPATPSPGPESDELPPP